MDFLHNGLVAQLPPGEQDQLQSRCTSVSFQRGQALSGLEVPANTVYFLTSGTVALVVRDDKGASLAVGLIGREGAVGLQLALGLGPGNLTLIAQSAGTAWSAKGVRLHALLKRQPVILLAFSRYLWNTSQEIAAMAAASQLQDIKGRLATWLLLSEQRDRAEALELTQLHLADMLGVRRVSVTQAAAELKALGMVDYQRGVIRILDHKGLAAQARGFSFLL